MRSPHAMQYSKLFRYSCRLSLLVPILVLFGAGLSDGQTVAQIKEQIAALQSRLADLHNQKTQAENAKPPLEASAQKNRDEVNRRMAEYRYNIQYLESEARDCERKASLPGWDRASWLETARKDRADATALEARLSEGPLMMNRIEIALQKGEEYIAHSISDIEKDERETRSKIAGLTAAIPARMLEEGRERFEAQQRAKSNPTRELTKEFEPNRAAIPDDIKMPEDANEPSEQEIATQAAKDVAQKVREQILPPEAKLVDSFNENINKAKGGDFNGALDSLQKAFMKFFNINVNPEGAFHKLISPTTNQGSQPEANAAGWPSDGPLPITTNRDNRSEPNAAGWPSDGH